MKKIPEFFRSKSGLLTSSIVVILLVAAGIGSYLTLGPSRGFDFGLNQKVSASSLLRLSFPEVMDQDSVEQYLTLPSGLEAKRNWEDNTLVLQPMQPLEMGKTYVVRVDGRAQKKDGGVLGRDLEFAFAVTGAPMVSAQIPAPETKNVAKNSEITIVFDRPIIPLTQVQGAENSSRADLPVTITPPIKGVWRWLGTSTATFVPDKGLAHATSYTVTVAAGVKTVSEDVTDKEYTWSFETERPQVVSNSIGEAMQLSGPTTQPEFTFNQEMDLVSVRGSVILTDITDEKKPKDVPIARVNYGTIEQNGKTVTDKKTIVVVPAKHLSLNTKYRVSIEQGAKGIEGNLGLETRFPVDFKTVGEFKVLEAREESGYISFVLSSSLSDSFDFTKSFEISPKLTDEDSVSYSHYTTSWNDSAEMVEKVDLFAPFEPSTKYTVTIKEGTEDSFGQKLKQPYTYTFTTKPLDPQVFIHPKWESFSIFEKGKPPIYFLNDVNVSSLDIEFGKLSFDSFRQIREEKLKYDQFAPTDLKARVQEYQERHIKPTGKQNEWKSTPFDLEKEFGKLSPGIYALSLRAPEWKDKYNNRQHADERYFAITNMAITLKHSFGKALVWVTDLQTGEPVSGAAVKFYSVLGGEEVTGQTNRDGFFETSLAMKDFKTLEWDYQPEFWVTAEKGDDFAFISNTWNMGIQPYDFEGDIYSDYRSPDSTKYQAQATLYTERPLYGAGDTVYFKGIFRLIDENGGLSVPDSSRSAAVSVTDANGTQIYSKTIKLSEFGTFNDSFILAKEAPLGYYSMQAIIVPEADIEGGAYSSFSVLAYRKPEYKVSISPKQEEYFNGQTATVNVSAQYYFGAPMANEKVSWRLASTDYFFNKYTEDWYSFALEDNWCWYSCQPGESIITEGQGTVDASGRLDIQLPLNIDEKGVSQAMTLYADITDKNNQVVSAAGSFAVHKSNIYVGVRSDDYSVASGQSATVKVITLKPDGSAAPNTNVDVKLYSRKWNVIQEKGVDGEYYYNSEPEDTFIRSTSVRTDAEGKGVASVKLDDSGEYRVVVSARDSSGRESKSGWSLYAWGTEYVNWPRSNNDRVDVIADKPQYKVGDTAKLLVKTPYQGKGVKALVTVERESVMTKKVIDVTSSALPIEVPITEDLVPVAYVSVVIIKPRQGETFNEHGLDTGAPSFKVGYVKLPINTESKKMTVTISTNQEKYVPGEKVDVTITAKDWKGNPVQGEFSLGVVDLSLLDLMGFSLPDLVSTFYYQRGLGVNTANMLTYLVERFKPGSKGGGGDGEEKTRGTFKDTAYWNPRIVTDATGIAKTSFTLPDNLTTWQLLALGSTKDSKFGGIAKTIIETKKVILRPVRPRFAVNGDKIRLGAIVHNYLDEDRTFTVSLNGEGFALTGAKEQRVSIPKQGNVKVEFPVTVSNAASSISLNFLATADGAKDNIVETIPVHPYGIEQTVATSGVTDTQVTEKVFVPSAAEAQHGSVTVNVAPSVAVYLPKGLEFLATFPYGCAEQTTSSFVPNIALKQLQGFEQFQIVDDKTLEKNVQAGLQKLYTFQRADGGFGYWESSAESYPYLTAYILHALKLTRDAGYAVDAQVMERGSAYLRTALKDGNAYTDLTTQAYGLFVLSEIGSSDAALLNTVSKKINDLPLFARAYVAMAYKKQGNNAKAKQVVDEIVSHASVSTRGTTFAETNQDNWYYSMNTNQRTTAIVLQALVRIDRTNPLVPTVIRGMLGSRINGRWDTTQSTTMSVLSLVEYLKATDELNYSYTGAADIGGKKKLDFTFKAPALEQKEVKAALADLVRGESTDVNVGKTGQGNLYYDVAMTYYYTPESIEPADEGIGILRETKPLTKADASMKVGTTQKVTLTITVPETRHFVAVESMLPAGMEAIDFNFATSQQYLFDDINGNGNWMEYYRNQMWRFSHIEYRDDRVFLFAEELPAGVYRYEYLVRATTPGKFRQRPAKVWEMYFPETFGQTAGGWMEIKE
jgi:uncharacterized protein YfaS (alpha-2-macroglobulin family)